MTHTDFQLYWWLIISLLGALLVFLMMIQGAQVLMHCVKRRNPEWSELIFTTISHKWELTFTTLVTFGGAFFASFPLFYSTSFSGAFYVWILLLLTFVLQAAAYSLRNREGNLLGKNTYNVFLLLNGILAPLVVGVAVGTFFYGANFTVNFLNIGLDAQNATISSWTTPWYGLEALTVIPCVILGLAVMTLTQTLGAQFIAHRVADQGLKARAEKWFRYPAAVFVVLFVTFLALLLTKDGFAVDAKGDVFMEPYKYLTNFIEMPLIAVVFLVGVLLVLFGIFLTWVKKSRNAIWFSGAGTVLAVTTLLLIAGYNNTAYYPSVADLQSSLTIANSSSSEFTLRVMSYVSLMIPFVVAYIWFVWRAMTRKQITEKELNDTNEMY